MEKDYMYEDVLPNAVSPPSVSVAKRQLMAFLTENTAPLLGTIRSYVQRMGLAKGKAVPAVAMDVLQEVAVEALDHADRFDSSRQPMAWLLGIAMNIIRQKKVTFIKQYQREVTFGRLAMVLPESGSEEDLLDMITPLVVPTPEDDLAANEQAELILSLVNQDDQRILQLAILHDFEREALARELGITPVAARVRLHRALNRLRSAWHEGTIQSQYINRSEPLERKKQ